MRPLALVLVACLVIAGCGGGRRADAPTGAQETDVGAVDATATPEPGRALPDPSALMNPPRTRTPTPSPTPTPIAGLMEFTQGEPTEFPPDTAVIVAPGGCCKGAGTPDRVIRYWRIGDGPVQSRVLFRRKRVNDSDPMIRALQSRPGELVAAVCQGPYCGSAGGGGQDATSQLFRSTDAGVTWEGYARFPGEAFAGSLIAGQLLVRVNVDSGEPNLIDAVTGRPYELPSFAQFWNNPVSVGGRRGWITRDSPTRILGDDGRELLSLSPAYGSQEATYREFAGGGSATTFNLNPSHVTRLASGGSSTLVKGYWSEQQPLNRALTSWIAGWASPVYPSSRPDCPDYRIPRFSLATVDIVARTIRPWRNPFLEGCTGASVPHLLSVQTGPLAEVSAGDTCLHLRTDPSTAGPSLRCFVSGVLFTLLGEERTAEGQRWLKVRAPDEQEGWAAAEFLVR